MLHRAGWESMSCHVHTRAVALLAIAATSLTAAAAHGAPRARDAGQKWGTVIVAADGARLQGCRVREDGRYGPVWRVELRGQNRGGSRAAVVRAEVVRGYSEGNSEGMVIATWTRQVKRGRVTRTGVLHASALRNDRLRMHVRRPDGSGTLTWVVEPKQLPSCRMASSGRHWNALMRADGARLQACTALVGGAYGPVWRVWARGNNTAGDRRFSFGMQVRRGEGGEQVIDEWNAEAARGEVTRVRVVHVSLLKPDVLIGGMGDGEGGAGGDQAPRWFAVC